MNITCASGVRAGDTQEQSGPRDEQGLGWTGKHRPQQTAADQGRAQRGQISNFPRAGNPGFIFYVLWNLSNFEMLATNF